MSLNAWKRLERVARVFIWAGWAAPHAWVERRYKEVLRERAMIAAKALTNKMDNEGFFAKFESKRLKGED